MEENLRVNLKTSIEESKKWFERAKKVLSGGVSSSARMPAAGTIQTPLYINRGAGSRVWDVDGNQFVDFLLSYGSLIIGHSHPKILNAMEKQIKLGTMFGTCNTAEVELAEQICKMVPCADQVRYANSGSEAIAGAIRAARGYTGKSKILKFEGHYHGWTDQLAVSNRPSAEEAGNFETPASRPHSKGIPSGVVDDIIICPWNEPEILKNTLKKYNRQIAAIIAEPLVANNACIMPKSGYLELLRTESNKRDIILIFDEIVTGFRIAPGGVQEVYGIIPDLAVYSKAIGGGMPISAFAGKSEIMEPISKNTVKHGGTYNGNPISAIVALETIKVVNEKDALAQAYNVSNEIMEILRFEAKQNNINCIIQGLGPMFQILFTDREEVTNYRHLFDVDSLKFGIFRDTLLENGIHINSSYSACWFVSTVHTPDDVNIAKKAIREGMKKIKK
ncbi:MAG: aspartate aminotransferase family protein [Spirochaetes bacterium]|nr:aspartate aminotransferase family protein [Spirochaetota bacterium]